MVTEWIGGDTASASGLINEYPVPESLKAFTRDQIKSLIGYFGNKFGEKFVARDLGDKYQVVEGYLYNLANDDGQYQEFLSDFRKWRLDEKRKAAAINFESTMPDVEPSVESVLSLPQVGGAWSIGGYHKSQVDGGREMLQMFDAERNARSFKSMQDIKNIELLSNDVLALLYSAMFDPVLGTAARPRKLMLKNAELAEKLRDKLSLFEIEVVNNLQANSDSVSSLPFSQQFSCYSCGLTTKKTSLKRCTACHSVYYCSNDCFKRDWKKKPVEASHKTWCPQFKSFNETLPEQYKSAFPFEFMEETSKEQFIFNDFLHKRRLLGLGYWELLAKTCSDCQKGDCPGIDHEKGSNKPSNIGDSEIESPYIDKSLTKLEEIVHENKNTLFKNWKEYYEARELSLDSPVAAILSTCLTIRYISTVLYPKLMNDSSKTLHVAVLEDEYNPKYAGLLKQMLFQLTDVKIKLSIYQSKYPNFRIEYKPNSTNINEKQESTDSSSLLVDIKHGKFPVESIRTRERPDCVIGFNCFNMVSDPDSARSIITALVNASIPIYFVNFCPMFTAMQQSWIKQVFETLPTNEPKIDARVSMWLVNPFASPLRLKSSCFNFPWYQNGLMYYVIKEDDSIS